jgi:hypothetical protein
MDMRFTPEIERMVQHYLASGAYRSPESVLTDALHALQEMETMPKTEKTKSASQRKETTRKDAPSVLDIFRDAWDVIPDEEFEAMPEDGAEQVDHYIYGTSKHPS